METQRKIIRDGYAEKSGLPGFRIESTTDHAQLEDLLELKKIEELNELTDAISSGDKTAIMEEAADAIEAILARATLHGVTPQEVEIQRIKKREALGGFEKGLILVTEEN